MHHNLQQFGCLDLGGRAAPTKASMCDRQAGELCNIIDSCLGSRVSARADKAAPACSQVGPLRLRAGQPNKAWGCLR